MSKRFLKILLVLLLIAAISYLYVLNPSEIEVRLSASRTWRAPAALVLVTVFSIGMLLTALFALYLEAKLYFRHWRERRQFETAQRHWNEIERVRELLAAEQFDRAGSLLSRILSENPGHTVARVMYAETLLGENHPNEALVVLDEGREPGTKSGELLLLAAQIHRKLGNHTASLDNLRLFLSKSPESPAALRLAAESSETLEKFEEAEAYLERLQRSAPQLDIERQRQEIHLKRLRIISDPAEQKAAVTALAKQAKDYSPAWRFLAQIEALEGNLEGAAKLFSRCYALDQEIQDIVSLAEVWLRSENPSRAVAAVRSTIPPGGLNTERGFEAQIFLIKLLLHLEMVDEAAKELSKLHSAVTPNRSMELDIERIVLQARVLQRQGKSDEALNVLLDSAREREQVAYFKEQRESSNPPRRAGGQLSPIFSTP